ncbi:hypothetical protein LCGC14_1551520 [marine sediment metagenome]|uniref:Uncharacterized protein n=1 Tax=marine sediment metagenome TaxID=412755 RepID=A0A0F9L657_9ZZZZ
MLVWLTAQATGIDTGALLGALTLAFVGQSILGWMKISRLEDTVKKLDKDFDRLHPRQKNPGHRMHKQGDQHAEER